ncbi:ABC transporter ATP-binding protein [Pseudomonas savastanoi pv. glycinea]|nr:ABC transporter ATP-binding protein [Pseudomonas savastanoi pv. glycinea]
MQFGPKPLFENVSVKFGAGNRYGLIGANGCGKSTFMKILGGDLEPSGGQVMLEPNVRLGKLRQDQFAYEEFTVLDTVIMGHEELWKVKAERDRIYSLPEMSEDDGMAVAELETEFAEMDGYTAESRAGELLLGLGIGIEQHNGPMSEVSPGWKLRVLLAQALFSDPEVLLLDEPTNHLDADSVAWLEHFLHDFPGTVVAITHDRYFLDNVAGWILELDRGAGIPYEGNYSGWLEAKSDRLAQESKQQTAHEKAMKDELEWVRKGAKARQSKSKARLQRFEEMQSQEFQKRSETNEIYIPAGPRLGDKVIEFKNVTKGYGDRVLIDNLSFSMPKGAIVGVIGGNGAGKSTLFRMLMGKEQPDSGSIEVGETVQLACVDQSRDDLDGSKSVFQAVSDGSDVIRIGNYEIPSRTYVGRFNFKGGDQQKFVKDLSGGERGRLHLALTLKEGGNVLLLDEPSNDLDVETLRSLEEALLDFPGAAIVISHDRWFLDRVATHILAYEDDSQAIFFEGNYTEYEADRKKRLGEAAAQPHRVRHKKLA